MKNPSIFTKDIVNFFINNKQELIHKPEMLYLEYSFELYPNVFIKQSKFWLQHNQLTFYYYFTENDQLPPRQTFYWSLKKRHISADIIDYVLLGIT